MTRSPSASGHPCTAGGGVLMPRPQLPDIYTSVEEGTYGKYCLHVYLPAGPDSGRQEFVLYAIDAVLMSLSLTKELQ